MNINDICKVSKVYLHVWFVVNRLSLNVTKTNYTMFGNRKFNTCISMQEF